MLHEKIHLKDMYNLKHDYKNEDSLDVLVNPLKHMINLLNFYKIEVEK